MTEERLQKVIARATGVSRRQAEELIAEGKVTVDGKKVTQLGSKGDPTTQVIKVRGKRVSGNISFQYLVFHKPRQCVVTRSDPEGRTTVYDFLPKEFYRLKPVGRLDYDSIGLLLLTDDGDLAEKLTHPRHAWKKVYEIKVTPHPGPRQIERLQKGILLDGRKTLPAEVEFISDNSASTWLRIALQEGRNRQVRRMCEKVGLTVKTLIRTEFGPLNLAGVGLKQWKLLKGNPINRVADRA